MRDWLRRVDPAFYHKEPYLLRTQAQIARYTEEAQAEVRLSVLTADRLLHAATTIVALAAYVAATAGGALDPHRDWLTLWAFAALAVAAARALPWSPRPGNTIALRDALVGSALIAIPALWTRPDPIVLALALLTGATLYAARGPGRIALLALAVGVLFGVRAHPLFAAPMAAVLAVGLGALAVRESGRVWQRRPQVLTWAAFATLLIVCAYTFAFNAPAIAPHVPVEIAAIAVAYLGVCIIAGRIRRAELIARPGGLLSIPQSIVPLLDRSHDHAIICRLE